MPTDITARLTASGDDALHLRYKPIPTYRLDRIPAYDILTT